ncbi:MAG: poly-gamma-glutamate biosynthesis protein PgsC/CapC, partial [Planctomycetota bacterium]
MFPLEIFPERSLAESVITTVWVGVFVVAYFNLRLGWTFSGLVVPGYLVPLLIAKPASAVVVCIEGVITYFIVRYICERFIRSGSWSSFFGRDRFFALIIASLVVRLVLDGWVLPRVGEFVNSHLDINYDYRNKLSSFGLIIVALIANQFWKTGFVGGLTPFFVTNFGTFLIVRFVLMEFTNFNIGNLEYMYENISASLVASPKAYIILLTCAFVASRMNLLYGWDFNGILIPSLLALEWYNPLTIATTFLEAFVILGLACLVLRLPLLQQTTIEGSRKLLLFFNLSYGYKLVLGHIQQSVEGLELSDYFGYGYLVPTLMAVKMHDKHIPLRLTRATLQTSLAGAIYASALGFLLTFLPPLGTAAPASAESALSEESIEVADSLADVLREDKLRLYERRGEKEFEVPLAIEIDYFIRGLRELNRYQRRPELENLQAARREFDRIGYELKILERKYVYLREKDTTRGWGIYAFHLDPASELVVEIPAPIEEWAVLESGAFLFETFRGKALAIGGAARKLRRDGASDVLRSGKTLYGTFHRIIGQR